MVVADDEADLQTIGGVAPKEGEAIVVGVLAITAIIQFIRFTRIIEPCGSI